MMAGKDFTEVKIIKRGSYYLTPLKSFHIDELERVLSKENRREIKLLGYCDVRTALEIMSKTSEAYVCRKDGGELLFVGGLWFCEDQDWPQMFAMFSSKIRENFTMLARGSRMLVEFFDQSQSHMSMTILADYEGMVSWATWLGFDPVGVSMQNGNKYVEFVRCNLDQNCVYDEPRQPVIH